MKVREVTLDDIESLFPVYKKCKGKRPLNAYPLADWIIRKNVVFFLAQDKKGKVVGFTVIRPKGEQATIDIFCFDPNCKEKGLKKKLLETSLNKLEVNYVTVHVSKKSKLADFYKQAGFSVVEEIPAKGGKQLLLAKTLHSAKKKKTTKILQKKKVFKKKAQELLQENLEKLEKSYSEGDEFGPDLLDIYY